MADGPFAAHEIPFHRFGEVIADFHAVPVSSDALPGEYTLAVGFYLESTRERLSVNGMDHVRMGLLTVALRP